MSRNVQQFKRLFESREQTHPRQVECKSNASSGAPGGIERYARGAFEIRGITALVKSAPPDRLLTVRGRPRFSAWRRAAPVVEERSAAVASP